MASLDEIVAYCQERLAVTGFPDYPGALNGLQMANNGTVSRLGAAVDAGLAPFRQAAGKGVDLLIVHHGMFWEAPRPFVGPNREKLRVLFDANLAVYSSHLPLDAHPELGNNSILARRLRLDPDCTFHSFQGRDVGLITRSDVTRDELRRRLQSLFARVTPLEFGSTTPGRIAIVTGGGYSAIDDLPALGVDTLVTGELKEHIYNSAQEQGLNVFACGHYATEVFGVCALAEELAGRFDLPWEFIATENPL